MSDEMLSLRVSLSSLSEELKTTKSNLVSYAHINVKPGMGGGGEGIRRAFETIFRPPGWAFDDTGLPGWGGGGAV